MKKTAIVLMVALNASFVPAESILDPVNEKGYGTFSGRVQTLSMYRDFEGNGNGANTTLGFVLGYTSPELAGLDAGAAYNYAFELHDNNNKGMLANDDINVLNEAWVRYRLDALQLPGTTAVVGRKINHGEVFRADDFRQKARALETIMLETRDITNTRLLLGHAIRLSNWIDAGDRWDFNDFGDVFGAEADTDGVTWGEGVYTGVEGIEVAVFDAYAWDVANLVGARAKWDATEESAVVLYYRHENDIGDAADRDSDAYGVALQQKVGTVTIEPGYFGVHGDNLQFQETTTGINHPLGASMIICSGQFNGGSDTGYLKATTSIGKTKLYALYNYTWHDHDKTPFNGNEFNVVVKRSVVENLSLAFKGGFGEHDGRTEDEPDADFLDARLFVTYTF